MKYAGMILVLGGLVCADVASAQESPFAGFAQGTARQKLELRNQLASQGTRVLTDAEAALRTEDPQKRYWAVQVLVKMSEESPDGLMPQEVRSLLRTALQDSAEMVRFSAAQGLARAGDASAAPVLAQQLQSVHTLPTLIATRLLYDVGGADQVPDLIANLTRPDEALRRSTLRTLQKITGASFAERGLDPDQVFIGQEEYNETQQWQKAQMEDLEDDFALRGAAVQIGDEQQMKLTEERNEAKNEIRREAMDRLGRSLRQQKESHREAWDNVVGQWKNWWVEHRGENRIQWLEASLRQRDPRVSSTAARTMGEMGDPAAVGPLIGALADNRSPVPLRIEAARSLGKLGTRDVIEPLLAALRDTQQNQQILVRDEVRNALRQLSTADLRADPHAWNTWWERVEKGRCEGLSARPFEVGRMVFQDNYSIAIAGADPSAQSARLEVRKWIDVEDRWFGKEFTVRAGGSVGEKNVPFSPKDQWGFTSQIQVNLTPDLTVKSVSREPRERPGESGMGTRVVLVDSEGKEYVLWN